MCGGEAGPDAQREDLAFAVAEPGQRALRGRDAFGVVHPARYVVGEVRDGVLRPG
ncbi:hypothetical protein ACH347_12140 [Saccharopolyspora sp. 5N102]|uniref:hypothetical protein n=1 Tax=Saccharopolyspora sp. 5N102 TaxID=3375155 RepID=UPI0037AFCDBD